MSTTHTIRTHCPFGLDGIDVTITYTYVKGSPATRNEPAWSSEVECVKAEAHVPLDPALQKLLDDWAEDWVGDEGFPSCCQQAGYDSGDSYD